MGAVMKKIISLSLLIVSIFILNMTLGGCLHLGPVPEREFKLYSNAFDEVRKNTELLFEDYIASKELQSRLTKTDKKTNKSRLPETFDPSSVKLVQIENTALSDRRAALEAVAQYNEIMLDLAAGRSVQEVKKKLVRLEGLFDVLAGSTLPCAGIIKAVFNRVILAAEKARSRGEFVSAFREAGEGEHAIIPAILDFFIEDTRAYSDMKKVLVVASRKKITSKFGTQGRMLFNIAGMYKLPLTEKELYSKRNNLEYEYNKLFSQINPIAKFIYLPSGGHETYTQDAHNQLENIMEVLTSIARQEEIIISELYKYNDELKNYVKIILMTKEYFAQVEKAIYEPSGKYYIDENIRELGIYMIKKASINNVELSQAIDLIRTSYIKVSEDY
jgi:hypothetical protein